MRSDGQSASTADIAIVAGTEINFWLIPCERRNASRMQAQLLPILNQSMNGEFAMNGHPEAQFSTIAELLFLNAPNLNFARLVSDLDTVLSRFRTLDRHLTWDYEDIASFDMPGTRIVLATSEDPRPGVALSLTLSVGPSHLPPRLNAAPARHESQMRHDALCSRLVERVRSKLTPDAILWHEVEGEVNSDVLDAVAFSKPKAAQRKDPDHPIFHSVDNVNFDAFFTVGFVGSNDRPHLPLPKNPELHRLREALYPTVETPPPHLVSPQMRLAAYSMNATLIVVSLPIGAALMTYSVLRGENMRMTSQALVATGVASTLMQSDFGQQIVALVGI